MVIDILCRKCKKEIADDSKFCNHCGTKQVYERNSRKRGNGQGTVYKDASGKWVAECTIGWDAEDGVLSRKKRKKRGFATKTEALEYLPTLRQDIKPQDPNIKFKDLYKKWLEIHSAKVSKSTVDCYKAAYKYFIPLYYIDVAKIRTEQMQQCVDECPHGRRTKENMKALGTSLWKYAMQLDLVDRNYAEYIYIKKEEKSERLSFTAEQLDIMWDKVSEVPELK